jgi:hypothetical protein
MEKARCEQRAFEASLNRIFSRDNGAHVRAGGRLGLRVYRTNFLS